MADKEIGLSSKFKMGPNTKDVTSEHSGTVTAIIGTRYQPLKSAPEHPTLNTPRPPATSEKKNGE